MLKMLDTDQDAGTEAELSLRRRVCMCQSCKYHGYDGYIRVKNLASWGKKFGRAK